MAKHHIAQEIETAALEGAFWIHNATQIRALILTLLEP